MWGEICTNVVSALLLNRDKSENPKIPFTGTVSRPDGSPIGWNILWLNPRNLGMGGYPEYTSIYILKIKKETSLLWSWIAALSVYQGFFYFPGKPFEKNYTKKLTTAITGGRMIRNISIFKNFILFLAVILKIEHRKGDDRELKRLRLGSLMALGKFLWAYMFLNIQCGVTTPSYGFSGKAEWSVQNTLPSGKNQRCSSVFLLL